MTRSSDSQLWNAGAQPERTALAWSRTGLANVALLGMVARLLVPARTGTALVFAAAAIPMVIAVAVAARGRYRHDEQALIAGRPLSDARLPVVCALLATVVGIGAAHYVIVA